MQINEAGNSPKKQYDAGFQRSMLQVANEGFWEWDLASESFWLNPFFSRLAGLSPDESIVDADRFALIIHPEERQVFFDTVLAGAANKAVTTPSVFRLLSTDGRTYWLESKSRAVDFDGNGAPLRIIGHITDITQRKPADEQLKELNRALLAISKGNQALLRASNEKELLNDICKIIVEVGGYRMAWVGYAEEDPGKTVRIVARAGADDGYLEKVRITWADDEFGNGPTGRSIRSGSHCVVHNMQWDLSFEPWQQEAIKHGYASALSCPLKNGQRVFGSLTIYASTCDAFDAEESELLSSLAENLAYGISMLQNRSARQLAEEELRQSEDRYRRLFQNQHIVMLIIDPESGNIVDANPAAVDFYGWNHDELCGMNMYDVNTLTPEELTPLMQHAKRLDCNRFTFSHRLANGLIRDVEVVSVPIQIESKPLLYSIITDVTDKKLTEKQLIEGNKRMHYILATANAGVWEYEIETKTTIWSDEIWRIYGIEPCSCEPSFENWLEIVIPEDRDAVRHAVHDALANGADFTAIWRTKTTDGTIRWIMSKGTPFRESDGTITRHVGIVVDITDRKKEEEKKQQLETQLRQAQRLETIGTLAGGIAHDFNNILTPILGYAEMGLLTFADDEAGQEYFREIMLAANRARNLVSQILAFSRAQEITPSLVSVPAVIDEALKLLRPSIPTSITIDRKIDRSCGNILADPSQIHQVVVNLCTNAYQAMDEAAGTIHIALEEVVPDGETLKALPAPHADRYALLSIADTGIGMDKATIERIFEPFFTTKSPQKGTGLGLSVVHGIITGYNGMITVNSSPAKGTAFRIYLPVIDGHAEHEDPEPALATGNASIMFIDDEPASTRMITLMLTKLGFSIQAFNSPLEALDCFRKEPFRFDLVITDLTMPMMNGVGLASEIHKMRPDLPIVLMTGYGRDLENIKAISWHGIRKFIKKPVKMSELSSTISEVISG
ncbi:MAG: PAS domain S-box protein [Chlorobiaceae bacterium]|nr:PAS domain S-box protein [Chlorobiaceae bacterium]